MVSVRFQGKPFSSITVIQVYAPTLNKLKLNESMKAYKTF